MTKEGQSPTMVQQATDMGRRAQSALSASPIYDLRRLSVQPTEHGLMISGRVSSFYHKQLAQEVVRAFATGLEVVNSIDVQ